MRASADQPQVRLSGGLASLARTKPAPQVAEHAPARRGREPRSLEACPRRGPPLHPTLSAILLWYRSCGTPAVSGKTGYSLGPPNVGSGKPGVLWEARCGISSSAAPSVTCEIWGTKRETDGRVQGPSSVLVVWLVLPEDDL